MTLEEQATKALEIAFAYSQIDGSHHKAWVIDQMVRTILGTPEAYEEWLKMFRAGEDGPDTYEWDEGIAP